MTENHPPGRVIEVEDAINNARIGWFQIAAALMCAAVLFVDGYNIVIISYVAPLLAKTLHVAPALLGWVLSASLIGNMIGLLFLSPFTYQIGQKNMAVLSVLFFGVAEILAGFCTTPQALIACRLVAGIGLSGALLSAVALTGELFPVRWRSSAVTYMYLGYTLGQMAAGGATRAFLDNGFSWREPIVFGGAFALVFALLMIKALPNSPEFLINRSRKPSGAAAILARITRTPVPQDARLVAGGRDVRKGTVKQLFEEGRAVQTVTFWVALTMGWVVVGSLHNWLPSLLVSAGLKHDNAVMTTVFVTSSGIVAGFLVGPLMDRLGANIVFMGVFVAGAVASLLLGAAVAGSPVLLIAWAAFALGFCSSGISKGANAIAVFYYPTALRPTGLGWAMGIGRFGAALGPILVGAAVQIGWTPAAVFESFAVPLLLGAAALLLAYRRIGRSPLAMPECQPDQRS